MNIGFRRWDEYESDLYAVRGGYGDELKSAFTKLSIGPPKNMVDAFTYMEAKKTSTWIELQDKLTSRLNIGSGHPSMKHRKDQIDHAKRNKNYLK
jgi:Zn-dependent protease with chaperone function